MSVNSIENKVAIVAGGAKNLGGLISRQLAEKGAKVVVHYNSDKSKADADQTIADIKASGSEAFAIQLDLTIPANNAKLFDEAIKAYGGVDIAINTTGMVIKKPIVEVTEADYDTIFAINSKAAFSLSRKPAKN